jgi:hypothetical protein
MINQFEGNCEDDDQTVEGAVPAVDLEGNVFVSWSFAEKIYFDRSLDGGNSWLDTDIIISTQPGGWSFDIPGLSRCNGMPVTAVDNSTKEYNGRIYVCWGSRPDTSENADVWISWSDDKGERWSDAALVHPVGNKKDQFLPWLSVDPISGFLYVVYYDRDETSGRNTLVSLSVSKDGGKTFKKRRISENEFSTPGKLIFFGDYNNISAYDGQVRPIWTQYEKGKLSIWTALIQNP